uniref:NADH-ubiquinone oxidoreductase chain 4 n=1 Tax=Eurytoma sp. TJS-2016 TaxID=1855182 RepID=A0A1X9HY30_9HYME|nr:NADH dehydrogenase subunit 4 [Eurytoma sp. TJS-2016]
MMKLFIYLILLNFLLMILEIKFLTFILFNMIFFMNLILIFSINYGFYWMLVYSWMGLDLMSMMLLILSLWIISLIFLTSNNFKNLKFYSFNMMMLLIFLILSFLSMNFFLFYLFFEISLIPTFILIMGWGYQAERLNASMYMLLYTLFASLPLLILLFYIYNYLNSLNYMILLNQNLNFKLNDFILFFYLIFAFLVKLPMFMFHLWLPKAHLEAPVTGSMILAAVLLKLGGYGCMRSLMFMLNLVKKFNYLFSGICIFGMIYLSLLSMRCNDFKLIVAYSSIVHMSMMLLGLISMSGTGWLGSFLMMIGHGFCSSALFLIVNFFYLKTKSRNLLLNKGLIIFFPSLILWWFLFCICNMAAPVSLNLVSEILILMSMFNWSVNLLMFLGLGMYMSAMYSLYLFTYSSHGNTNNLLKKLSFNSTNEFLNLSIHWIPLNLMILKMNFFI